MTEKNPDPDINLSNRLEKISNFWNLENLKDNNIVKTVENFVNAFNQSLTNVKELVKESKDKINEVINKQSMNFNDMEQSINFNFDADPVYNDIKSDLILNQKLQSEYLQDLESNLADQSQVSYEILDISNDQ